MSISNFQLLESMQSKAHISPTHLWHCN